MIQWLQQLMEGFAKWPPIVQAVIRALLLVLPILTLVPGIIWYERRLLSWMQDRIGPNRVGNFRLPAHWKILPPGLRGRKFKLFGLLQPIADGVKLFFKEDVTPASVDRVIYFLAPALALFPAFALGATIPFGPYTLLTPVADVNIGVLYMLAISSLGVYGVVLGGYAGNNKYSLMGGLRSAAQLISYELAMGMSLAAIVLATGSLRMTDMVAMQEQPLWGMGGYGQIFQNWFILTPYGFISGIIFLVCMVAETNRAPFDLPEAENELIAGYHTEYSSMKFAVYFMGEYAAMFIFSAVFATVFLGGWNIVPINWGFLADNSPVLNGLFGFLKSMTIYLSPIWMVGKIIAGLTFYIWLRATLPRLRYDQLMSIGWRSMLPLATLNFMAVATWIFISARYGSTAGIGMWVVAGVVVFTLWRLLKSIDKGADLEVRTVKMVGGKPAPVVEVEPERVAEAVN